MAGIGWKLEQMMASGTWTARAGAYTTGVAVTSGPWLLTTLVLLTLRLSSGGLGEDALAAERILTWIYALTVVVSAPVHIVVSRYAADRLYEERTDAITAPLRRALTSTLFVASAAGTALMLALKVPSSAFAPGVGLTTTVAAQWLLMAVGGGLTSPMVVVRAFALGAPLSFGLGALWVHPLGTQGYLWGYAVGQLLTLGLLLRGVLQHLPAQADETARLTPAFMDYAVLSASALAYHAAMWSDEVVSAVMAGPERGWRLAALSAVAWLSVVPAFAWIYVRVETAFYRRFRSFYDSLEAGASLPDLKLRLRALEAEVWHVLGRGAWVQVAASGVAVIAGPWVLNLAGAPAQDRLEFYFVLAGAGLQVMCFCALLVLYYFDQRAQALSVSLTLFLGGVLMAVALGLLGLPFGISYAGSTALALGLGLFLLRRTLKDLLFSTFQAQPLAVSS